MIDRYEIAPHFYSDEVECKCKDPQCQFGARVVPDPRVPGQYRSEMHPLLLSGLVELREDACKLAGEDAPIIVNSGARCPNHNYAIGGHPNSQHLSARAVDVYCPKLTIEQLHKLAKQNSVFKDHGVGLNRARNFLHLDVGPKNHFTYAGKSHARDTKDGEYIEVNQVPPSESKALPEKPAAEEKKEKPAAASGKTPSRTMKKPGGKK